MLPGRLGSTRCGSGDVPIIKRGKEAFREPLMHRNGACVQAVAPTPLNFWQRPADDVLLGMGEPGDDG